MAIKRDRAFEAFTNQCVCGETIEAVGFPERWRLVPATTWARRFALGRSLHRVYALDDQELLDNFELLCPYHYGVWLDEEEDNDVWAYTKVGRAPRSARDRN